MIYLSIPFSHVDISSRRSNNVSPRGPLDEIVESKVIDVGNFIKVHSPVVALDIPPPALREHVLSVIGLAEKQLGRDLELVIKKTGRRVYEEEATRDCKFQRAS